MTLRFILARILRELIGVLTLSIVLPSAAATQDMAGSLDELLHSGSLEPGEGGLRHRRQRSTPEGHDQRHVVNRAGGHA